MSTEYSTKETAVVSIAPCSRSNANPPCRPHPQRGRDHFELTDTVHAEQITQHFAHQSQLRGRLFWNLVNWPKRDRNQKTITSSSTARYGHVFSDTNKAPREVRTPTWFLERFSTLAESFISGISSRIRPVVNGRKKNRRGAKSRAPRDVNDVSEASSENPLTRWRGDMVRLLRTNTAATYGSLITQRVPLA